ncbi:MAG: SDR family NAD(P)-dependent oxidoreductase [Silicimonas sp.]|jgi:short-subunit dehydrogenase|nr:SDR family NAD(P)-dependent oxidoreductase [Silicimonas sp.]
MTATRIIITGATGGIGRALVREYARPGTSFLLFGRNGENLAAAQHDAEQAGAIAETCAIPATDYDDMANAMLAFDASDPVDLVLLCAGVKTGNRGGVEPPEHLDRVLAVNLTAPIRHAQAILPRLRERDRGQIAFFSSLAALAPQADILSYSASKSGLRAYAAGLRRDLIGTGVSVHVITPGFVDTPMTDRHLGHTPLKISAERAAVLIRRGLSRGQAYITFPRLLVLLVRLQNLLPVAIADRIDRNYRAEIVPDGDEADGQSQG